MCCSGERYEFRAPLQNHETAAWTVCVPENLEEISALFYFIGKQLQERLQMPVGILNLSLGGTSVEAWTSRQGLAGQWEYQISAAMRPVPEQEFINRKPTGLFQGMVAPCLPFCVKGMVWYQGESNDCRRLEGDGAYEADEGKGGGVWTFKTMVSDVECWDVENPVRYRLWVTLRSKGEVWQTEEQTVGFRTVRLTPGEGFWLNGRRLRAS